MSKMKKSTQNLLKKSKKTKTLEKIWYDPENPAGFGGQSKLSKASGKPIKKTQEWLKGQMAYTLNKPRRIHFPTRQYKTSGVNDLWQMDLMEMIIYSQINNGYKYILTCIDVFSRFARAAPLKTKSANDVSIALQSIFKSEKPRNVQTDLGKEFYNSKVKSIFKEKSINHYSVHSQFKAATVERFNRTLRERLSKFFTKQGNKKWVNVLQSIMLSYNTSHHRSINMRPVDVVNHESELWYSQNHPVKSNAKYKIDDYVRMSKEKGQFIKNFDQNWSDEIFQIIGINQNESPVMYSIKDYNDEPVQGKFYEAELQVVDYPLVFRIQTILKTKGSEKDKQYYVKWHGYTEPSWIKATDLV